MKRPWYLHGLFIFLVGNFTCGIGWIVLGVLRINWEKQHKDNLFNSLVQNNGDAFTKILLNEIVKFHDRHIGGNRLILIQRNFTEEGCSTAFVAVALRDKIEHLYLEEAKQEGYKIKMLEDNRAEISRVITGYNISNSELKQYIKYMGNILREMYQDNGNDVVAVEADIIAIMCDIKEAVLMMQNN